VNSCANRCTLRGHVALNNIVCLCHGGDDDDTMMMLLTSLLLMLLLSMSLL
jgi:hypothetical protein